MVFYLDTSAFVEFVAIEEFSASLREWVQQTEPEFVASDLLRIEALRAARGLGPEYLKAARQALQHVHVIAPLTTGSIRHVCARSVVARTRH